MPTPWNNPYIPGDPFSYDLKWLVSKIKSHDVQLDNLDQRIIELIGQLLDQHDPIYWENAEALIHSEMKTPSLAYIEGFYSPGDGGANLYFVTSDYNDVLAADFYLTLDGANRWAIPIILTPYVTPEMFGAKGDGNEDDSDAIEKAFAYPYIIFNNKQYILQKLITVKSGQKVTCQGTILIDYDYASLTSEAAIFKGDDMSSFSWEGGLICGTGADNPNYLNLFLFDNSTNITFSDIKIINMPMMWNILCRNSAYLTARNITIDHYSYGAIGFAEGSTNGVVEGCHISNLDVAGTGTGYPIMVSGGSTTPLQVGKNMLVKGNVVDNSQTIARWEGIDAHGGENIKVIDNIVIGCITGIAVATTTDYTVTGATIAGNTIIGRSDGNAGSGINAGGYDIEIYGNTIKGFVQTYRSTGISITYGRRMHVHDNVIYNCKVGLTLSTNDGETVIENNLIDGCGNYTDNANSPAILLLGLQTNTKIINNHLNAPDGVYRGLGNSYQHTYLKYFNNRVTNPVNATNANINNMISDIAVQQPTNSTTPMGYLGDIVQLATPAAGNPYSWICTSAWNGSSATWSVYVTL